MKKNHNFFSNLALNLAENHLGKTKLNPSVGCVVVKNGSVISSGVTSLNGRPHAEYNALNKNLDFKNSTMYVSLEPCTHFGRTPPCTKIIKKKKIKSVYFCNYDPDHRTYKKAQLELRKNNIKVKKISIKKNQIYKSYFWNKTKDLPLLDAKIAISSDNFTINKKGKWITNSRSRTVSHLLRSKYDSIISTSKSINIDNSLLNCRINGLDNSKPDLIIIDRYLKLRKNLKLINFSRFRKTYILTTCKENAKLLSFKKNKIKIIKINKFEEKRDFLFFLKKLKKLGKGRILVEAGLTFINRLIEFGLISDLYIFKSCKRLKRNGYNNSKMNFIKKINRTNKIDVNLLGDTLFKARIK